MQTFQKVAIGSGLLLILGVSIGFIGFPKLLRSLIKKQVNLKPGSDTRALWEKYPFFLNFSVYVFNVTNPDEVQNGEKPKLSEVGPFFFEEWKDKYDIEDIEAEDTVMFNMRNTFIFRPDLGLSGEELITIPHPLIQLIGISIKRDKAAMIDMIAQGIDVIFNPISPFIKHVRFMDIFFRGIDVDCSSDNFAAKAICLSFHSDSVKGGVRVNETHFKFSLMGGNNHTNIGRFKVSRGIKVNRDVGTVLQFQEEDELSNWNGDDCNRFHGTDGTIFPPLLKPSEGLWAFTPDICRSMALRFQKKSKYDGVPTMHYTMDFGDVKNEPENQCFCPDYPDNCPAKGTMNLNPCVELPLVASLPHFLNADPKLLQNVDGLQPNESKHGIFVDFEIISGTPLSIAKRLQFSFDVEPIPEIAVMKELQPLVMPVFWVEEAVNLNSTFTGMLKKQIFTTLKIVNVFKWTSTILGIMGLIFAAYLFVTNTEMRTTGIDAIVYPRRNVQEKY